MEKTVKSRFKILKLLGVKRRSDPFVNGENRLVGVVDIFFLEVFDHRLDFHCAQQKVVERDFLILRAVASNERVKDANIQVVAG